MVVAAKTAAETGAAELEFALRLRRACDGTDGPDAMLGRVAALLREAVPCDIVTFMEVAGGEDADDPPLFRGRFATDRDKPFTWPARWVTLDPSFIAFLCGDDRRIDDLDKWYQQSEGGAELQRNPVAQEYERRAAKRCVCIPRIDGSCVRGVISLVRRRGAPAFTEAEQRRLDGLGLDRVMRLAAAGYAQAETRLAAELSALFEFDPGTSAAGIAKRVVDAIGSCFGWEYVALFRVAHARGRFELVAQYDPSGTLLVRPDYTQPLEGPGSGMLGATRRSTIPVLRAGDVRPPNRPFDFQQTNDRQASAMCVQVRLGGQVGWVLDCESSQVDGFSRPDEIAICAAVAQMERTLRLWFESRLNDALLNRVDQGVVVVDEHHCIERLNAAAQSLLGPTARPGRALSDFAASETARSMLGGASTGLPASNVEITLSDGAGSERRVLASAREPEDTFFRRIWLFRDLEEQQWIDDLDTMRRTIQDVAAQARGPLLLAQALMRQAGRLLDEGGTAASVGDMLERAAGSLAKTDITYQRLTTSSDAIREPQRARRIRPFDLPSAFDAARRALTAEDQKALRLELPAGLPPMEADGERMSFAVRSVVDYLLSVRAPAQSVTVRGTAQDGSVSVVAALGPAADVADGSGRLRGSAAPVSTEAAQVAAEAAQVAAQALTAARMIVESHGGQLCSRPAGALLEVELGGFAAVPHAGSGS